MLLLWLFSVGVGVANACLGPIPGTMGSLTPAHADLVAHEQPAAGGHAMGQDTSRAVAHGGSWGHEGSAFQSNCVDFCDKASLSIPPVKSALDDLQGQALRYPAVAVVHSAQAGLPVQLRGAFRQRPSAPPIHIAFLRLAL